MDLRQVALVAARLSDVRQTLFSLLGLSADFSDPGVAEFGLNNSVMAIGDTFLEVVSPFREGTTAGRLLERRGGDGGYMLLVQVDGLELFEQRISKLGIRKIWETERSEVSAFHVHPKDIGAAIVSFDEMRPADSWLWAGDNWQQRKAKHVSSISGIDIQAADPAKLSNRWSQALGVDVRIVNSGYELVLDSGLIRIELATDDRGDGISAVQFDVLDADALYAAAAQQRLVWQGEELNICGTRFRFQGL